MLQARTCDSGGNVQQTMSPAGRRASTSQVSGRTLPPSASALRRRDSPVTFPAPTQAGKAGTRRVRAQPQQSPDPRADVCRRLLCLAGRRWQVTAC
jgi:hypothetical protein